MEHIENHTCKDTQIENPLVTNLTATHLTIE